MEVCSGMNLVDAVIDEIALEGLDGITLEALWARLALRFGEKETIPVKLMEQIWNICLQVRQLNFYQLEVPREKLVIFNRYDFVDPDLGIILEPPVTPDDIYPHCPIDDVKNGIRGSCGSYYTRKEISDTVKTLSVHGALKIYGQSLAIVASQKVRNNALMDKTVCPTLELTVIQYCFLERVGRARYHGEVTQGKLSLSLLQEDPRSLFYHRKFLRRHKLLTKQMHHQKSGGHSCTGSLLHLPRFFVERKPKVIYLAQKVIEILKSRENHAAEYSEIKKELGLVNSIKKLFKTTCFQNVVKTDLVVPYRTLYPHASREEWQRKGTWSKEKRLRVVQLIDNSIDVSDLWNKDEPLDDDEPFELDISEQKYNVPYLKQVNELVEASGHEGLCQSELAVKMGLTKLQARTFFRNLSKSNIVAIYMNDMGRQRVAKCVSRKYEDTSRMSKQFKREVCKMRKFAETPMEKTTEEIKAQTVADGKIENPSERPVAEKTIVETMRDDRTSDTVDVTDKSEEIVGITDETEEIVGITDKTDEIVETTDESKKIVEITDKTKEIVPTSIDDKPVDEIPRSFDAATKILQRYKVPTCARKYKRTFRNVAGMKDETMEAVRRNKRPRLAEEKSSTNDNVTRADEDSQITEIVDDVSSSTEGKLVAVASALPSRPNISGLMDELKSSDTNNPSTITYRLLKRANIIIESVKEHRVIDDMTKLMKMITEEEEKEGYDVKIDKRSLIRLLQRLAKDDLVKNIRLTLSGNGKEKKLTFVCDPSIDVNHTIIKSAVEQARIKFCLIEPQKVETTLQSNGEKIDLSENADETNSTEKLNEIDKECKKAIMTNLSYDTKAGRRYGYCPKFIRMQRMHTFLFYLIYEHPGKPTESKEKMVECLRSRGLLIDEKLEKEIDNVYNIEVGWKMFIPPLPKHTGYGLGWAMMCDILLHMPLSIFLKVHKVSYNIPELGDYCNHPLRKHLLVKDMPPSIRNVLFIRRRYIYSIHDVVTRLCYIGLLQFGPQRLKEKDKIFVYLNRNAELADTTSSAVHYHKIENKPYPVTKYRFVSSNAIEKYWYKLRRTCENTRLGCRTIVQGKDIVLEDLDKKFEMIESTRARGPDEAPLEDNGRVPGDHMGAAGLDSAFFAHLKRNWSWEKSNYPFKRMSAVVTRGTVVFEGERYAHMSKVKPKPLKFTEYHGLRKIAGPVTVDAVDLKKSETPESKNYGNGKKSKKQTWSSTVKAGIVTRQRSYVRRVMPRQSQIRSRVKYDDVDYSALQRMDKLRVDWDTREDNMLLVCKVAMMYLCPNRRRQFITFSAVRDVLRSHSLKSHNKTSRACQRRLHYMLKKPQTYDSVVLGLEELKQNFHVNRRFGDIVDRIKKQYGAPRQCDEQLTVVFRDLVAYIAKKNYDITDIQSAPMSFAITTDEEFRLFHRIKIPMKLSNVQKFHDETINDIHSSTINSVIHSSMCCGKDRRSWAYQLFRIYQQYPEWLLRSTMAKIRADQMISVKKHYAFAMKKQPNACMPMNSSQYQLSSGYLQKFNTKLPYAVFKESHDFFVKLVEHYNESAASKLSENDNHDDWGIEAVPVTGGAVAAVHDYINVDKLDVDVEIPQHIIKLDLELSKDDERYVRIARRYHDLLRNIEHIHMDEIFDCSNESNERKNSENKITDETNDDDFEIPKKIRKLENNVSVVAPTLQRDSTEANRNENTTERDTIMDAKNSSSKTTATSSKFRDSEPNVNNDNEVFETDHEVNFDDDDDDDDDCSVDEIDDADDDEDDFICFLDGTRMRLTRNDIDGSARNDVVGESENRSIEASSRDAKAKSNDEDAKCESDRTKEISENVEDKDSTITRTNGTEDRENIADEEISSNEKSDRPLRVNEMIAKVGNSNGDRKFDRRTKDANDADRRCTRIALLKMREGLNDLSTNDSHHAHEYFVLNMFKIFYSFGKKRVMDQTDVTTYKQLEIPKELLPLSREVYADVINDLRKFATFPKARTSYNQFKRDFQEDATFVRGMDAVYEFVREKFEIGASLNQLVVQFYGILGDELFEILSVLKEARLVLRSGVKSTRYVNQKYADPWLIHSYKIMRLRKEGLQPVPCGSFYVASDEKNKNSRDSNGGNDLSIEEAMDEGECKKNRGSGDAEGENGVSSQRKIQKSRTCLLQTKDVYRAAKQLDLDTAAEIRVVVRPWIRVDGGLNRRVLDRMLGGLLAYCLINPGAYLSRIQEKFAPAIQPFHTKELVEILVKLKCLKIGAMRKARVTLLSKSSFKKPKFSDITDRIESSEGELVVEPELGATLTFGVFLSNRAYTSDFL